MNIKNENPYKKDKKNKSQNKNNSKIPINLEISPGIIEEQLRDSIEKKSINISNSISLQSLNDSKMMELARHYGVGGGEESSSGNYLMNNVIYNKKQYFSNYQGLYGKKKHKRNKD